MLLHTIFFYFIVRRRTTKIESTQNVHLVLMMACNMNQSYTIHLNTIPNLSKQNQIHFARKQHFELFYFMLSSPFGPNQ